MQIDVKKLPKELYEIVEHTLPNGGIAVLDNNNRIACYNKKGVPNGNNWDYVKGEYRKN